MILLVLLLRVLTATLDFQLHGVQAESNLSSKYHFESAKEQNGVQDSQHEKIVSVSFNGSIHSPRFPHTYPRSTVMVWRLIALEEHMRIQLTFDEKFGLEDPEDDICKYDFVEIEDPSDGTILGRWCGSNTVPSKQISKGNQIRVRFVSDEYFPSSPGFCIHYTLLTLQQVEPASPSVLPPSSLPLDELSQTVARFSTVEEVIRYLEPDKWQVDIEELYKPTWQLLGKAYIYGKKPRVDLSLLKDEVRLYSCTPRNYSVSLREELKRTDAIFWPSCLLVKRCGGNCSCCNLHCNNCQCIATKVTKKFHEVLQLKQRNGMRGLHKSLTDVSLEHHEECACLCKGNSEG
ncbi:platelet-derived growth factor C [Discoglossus pictus]